MLKKAANPEPQNAEGLTHSQLEYLAGVKKVYGPVTEAEVKGALLARKEQTENDQVARARYWN